MKLRWNRACDIRTLICTLVMFIIAVSFIQARVLSSWHTVEINTGPQPYAAEMLFGHPDYANGVEVVCFCAETGVY